MSRIRARKNYTETRWKKLALGGGNFLRLNQFLVYRQNGALPDALAGYHLKPGVGRAKDRARIGRLLQQAGRSSTVVSLTIRTSKFGIRS